MPERDERRYQGEIVEWSDEKRCGFLRPRGAARNDPVVFLPVAAVQNRKRPPKVGDTVLYEVETSRPSAGKQLRTRYRAVRVTYLGEDPPFKVSPLARRLVVCLGIAYWGGLAAGSALAGIPQWPIVVSIALSAIAFLAYGWDKLMALRGGWRVPEANLHLISMLGGWPGSAIGQSLFGHKTLKADFQAMFVGTVVANVLLTALGATILVALR